MVGGVGGTLILLDERDIKTKLLAEPQAQTYTGTTYRQFKPKKTKWSPLAVTETQGQAGLMDRAAQV